MQDVLDALERGYTLPASWYADPAVLRLEHERIFRRSWQYAGRADQVADAGTYFACRVGDVPVVVTRDRRGKLRAFANVCRHRGHEVARGEGRRETLQCAYHAWTYGLDGELRAAPRADREAAFDRRELSLLPVSVETWGPFAFVNPDPEARPLADALGELPALLARGGIDVESLRFRERISWHVEANWKVAAENYLECYHCLVAHAGFVRVVDVDPAVWRLEADGLLLSQFGPARDGSEDGRREYDPRGAVADGQFHLVWPSTCVNVMPGRGNLSIGPLLPAGPERTERFLDYFFAPDTPDEWIADLMAFDDQVGREDASLVESVQRGLRSGMVEHGRLLPESERLVQAFQRLVAEALADRT